MKLVTVATHSERYYPYLKLSAQRNRFDLVTLGWGEKWKGFTWRFELMRKYLLSLDEDEIICFVDGYDVIVLQDMKTLEEKFISKINGDKSKIVIALEIDSTSKLSNFILKFWYSFFSYKCNNKFINAGTYIGYASTLINLFNSICDEFECRDDADDQILLQRYCAKIPDIFIFDDDSNLFLTLPDLFYPISSNSDLIKMKNKILTYKNNTKPSIFHAPTNSNIDEIIKELGYDTTLFQAAKESKLNYQIKFMIHFIKEIYLRYEEPILIIIIIFLILFILLLSNKQK